MVESKKPRLPSYTRAAQPPIMGGLQERDYAILSTIYRYDGLLSVDQIQRWFFGSRRNTYRRLSILYHNGYINRANRQERHLVPEPVVYLTKKAQEALVSKGVFDYPLREEPRWSKINHDIGLNEFRHKLETATKTQPAFTIEDWFGQDKLVSLFSSPVSYRDENGHFQKRRVQPDGLFSLRVMGEPPRRTRFCVEYDNGTESISRFARDKVCAGIAFIQSEQYQSVLQTNLPARYLVVVNGSQARFDHMRSSVTAVGGAFYFFFAHEQAIPIASAFTDAAWHCAHNKRTFSLAEFVTPEFQTFLKESMPS
jgi:hypothetical protein